MDLIFDIVLILNIFYYEKRYTSWIPRSSIPWYISVDEYFLLRSTLKTDKTKEWEGKEYPYYTVEVSSASHPFYTGKQKIIDTGGRVQKFEERFGKKK